jgi:hypothetical protein
MEAGVPVVYAKEHDDDNAPWVGSGNHGWPVFTERPFPSFSDLNLEPRVALQGFKDIKKRAEKMCDRWKQTLADAACLNAREELGPPADDPGKERQLKEIQRKSMQEAIVWWTYFLTHHECVFGSGQVEWSFAVEEVDSVQVAKLLPFAPHTPAACPSSMEVSIQPGSSMEVSMEARRPFVAR